MGFPLLEESIFLFVQLRCSFERDAIGAADNCAAKDGVPINSTSDSKPAKMLENPPNSEGTNALC